MNGLNCVKGEIHNVLAVLRVSGRSRSSNLGLFDFAINTGVDDNLETLRNKLIVSFKELHGFLGLQSSLKDIDTCVWLRPFIDLILSDIKGVDVMNMTLSAVHKFLLYSLLDEESPNICRALHEILNAVIHAKFDRHSRSEEELVSIRSMEVLLEILRCPAGYMLSDDDVCEIIQHVFEMRLHHSSNNSVLMVRYIENVLIQMIILIFSELVDEDIWNANYHSLLQAKKQNYNTMTTNTATSNPKKFLYYHTSGMIQPFGHRRRLQKMTYLQNDHNTNDTLSSGEFESRSMNNDTIYTKGSTVEEITEEKVQEKEIQSLNKETQKQTNNGKKQQIMDESQTINVVSHKNQPFGVKAMVRIFRYLTHLINPNIPENTTNVREFGLRLINVALETSGRFLNKHNELIAIIQDDLCRHLLTNSQSQHFGVLSLTLRVIFDLFNAVKEVIRVQLEVFFISIHLRIAESSQSSFEQKELVLESIVEFCREPDLIVGLYTNYDCQVGCTHLFEDLCKFLAQQAMPNECRDNDNGMEELNDLHFIAAEGILAIIDCICRKFCTPHPFVSGSPFVTDLMKSVSTDSSNNGDITLPLPRMIVGPSDEEHLLDGSPESKRALEDEIEEIRRQQQRKRRLKLAANHFNNKGYDAFEYLQQIGVLQQPLSAENVSEFFHTNPYLDKVKIGIFLGSNKPFHQEVLKYYVAKFDFRNMSIDEALRMFLESFVLRGEAQQVSRIIEVFSEKYFEEQPKDSPLRNKDAAFLVAFSIIQLNTDAHNAQIRTKMTLENYKLNLKGLNGKEDFPIKFIEKIYYSITSNEIKIRTGDFRDIFTSGNGLYPNEYYYFEDGDSNINNEDENAEHAKSGGNYNPAIEYDENGRDEMEKEREQWGGGDSGSEREHSVSSSNGSFFMEGANSGRNGSGYDVKRSEWKHVLRKARTGGKFKTVALHSNGMEMFNILWEPALRILEFHLQCAGHPKVLERISQGFKTLARIAHCYQIRSAFNAIVHSICNNLMVNLLQFAEENRQNIKKTAPSLLEGKIAFVLKMFFDLVHNHGGLGLTDGWSSVMKVILWLLHLNLIPESIFEMDDFTDSKFEPLPSIGDPSTSENNGGYEDNGVWTNWLSSAWNALFSVNTKEPISSSASSSHLLKNPSDALSNKQIEDQSQNTAASGEPSTNRQLVDKDSMASGKNASPWIENSNNSLWQTIIDQVSRCDLSKIFSSAKFYHLNTLLPLTRTLIALSPSSLQRTGKGHVDTLSANVTSKLSPSKAHVLTSLDPLPVKEFWSDGINEKEYITEEEEKEKLEEKQIMIKEEKEPYVDKDMICLPLSLEMKVFCLERLGQVVMANMERLTDIWAAVSEHYQNLLRSYQVNNTDKTKKTHFTQISQPDFMFERVVVHVMKLCSYLSDIPDPNIRSEAVTFLHLILCLDDTYLFAAGRRIVAGLVLLLSVEHWSVLEEIEEEANVLQTEENNVVESKILSNKKKGETKKRKSFRCIVSENDWAVVLRLLKRFAYCEQDKQCCLEAFQLVEVISKEHGKEVNFVLLLEVLSSFARSEADAAVHCKRVIDVIYTLHNDIANFSEMSSQKLNMMWYKSLHAISNFGRNGDYHTRRYAINCLQKALITQPVELPNLSEAESGEELKLVFEHVLLPLLAPVTKQEIRRFHHANNAKLPLMGSEANNNNNADLRMTLLTIIFHIFNHKLDILAELKDFHEFWYHFLKCVKEFLLLNADNESIVTHCMEWLKNSILVVKTNKIMDRVSQMTGEDVWTNTWAILEEVSPSLQQQMNP